uniref:NADH dehydrogenase subunit 6 n=1 Tax=Acrobeloides nanus TaxID=290746 RepID=A0A914E7U9_9BILA
MKTYRWYLIYLICWSLLNSIVLTLLSPSLLSPYLCILINSPFEGYLNENHWYTIFEVYFFGCANLVVGMIASFLYRSKTFLFRKRR